MSYAELLCLTNFSFQHGASHPRELVARAKELGYTALAIANECSLAGIVRAHEAAEACQMPLIIGSQFRLEDGNRIALLAPSHDAYTQLCALISKARRQVSQTGDRGRFEEIHPLHEQRASGTPGADRSAIDSVCGVARGIETRLD